MTAIRRRWSPNISVLTNERVTRVPRMLHAGNRIRTRRAFRASPAMLTYYLCRAGISAAQRATITTAKDALRAMFGRDEVSVPTSCRPASRDTAPARAQQPPRRR